MKRQLHPTHHDLPEATRRKVVDLLNQHLADTLDLGTQIKQAHWNVKGPSFISLHLLFDEAAGQVGELIDEIAERAVQLGGTALGTARVAAQNSRLPEYPLDIFDGKAHVEALAKALASVAKSTRAAIDQAAALGDADTADLLTGGSRTLDTLLWKVEAHGQAKS